MQNNTIVGPWVSAITVSMPKTVLEDNTHYGRSLWGSFSTEPGNNKLGHGTIKNAGNNEIEKDIRKAPAPPKKTK